MLLALQILNSNTGILKSDDHHQQSGSYSTGIGLVVDTEVACHMFDFKKVSICIWSLWCFGGIVNMQNKKA